MIIQTDPHLHIPQATMLTGAVDTRSSFAFQYGKIELRMRTNMLPGNFPAAWLLPMGVGNAHKCFKLSQILIAKRLAVWRLGHNGESH